MTCPRLTRWLVAVLCLATLAAPASGRTRPDQVLVVYNKDWTQDLDGSAPGQDSEEIARYYVDRHTDPATGRKPYLLGLSTGDPADRRLNKPVLKEESSDNWLGLIYKGKDELVADPWPLTKRGELVVDLPTLVAARGAPRFAVAFITAADLGQKPQQLTLTATPADGTVAMTLLDAAAQIHRRDLVSVARVSQGLLVAVDLVQLDVPEVKIRVSWTPEGGQARAVSATYAKPTAPRMPEAFVPLRGEGSMASQLPDHSAMLPGVLGTANIVGMMSRGNAFGIRVPKKALADYDPATLVVAAGASADRAKARVLYQDGQPADGVDISLYELKTGDWLAAADFADVAKGTVWVWIEMQPKAPAEGEAKPAAEPYVRRLVLYDADSFEPSTTGPDGVRDDQAYLDLIERPIKEFLENTRSGDGVLLKNHVLYIVVVRGLPYQVRSFYGIERGSPSVMRRSPDMGSGSALTQRVRMLYYDPTQVRWGVTGMLNGGRDGIRIASIANPLRACMTGSGWNPYMHPLTHNAQRRQRVWSDGKLKALGELRPKPFTSQLRGGRQTEKWLYAATRIDARSVEAAKAEVDAALYAERYFTPKMGTVYYGSYQEAPLAAELLKEMGFTVKPVPDTADRALAYFGVFGNGALYREDLGTGRGTECVWMDGFLPGADGTAIRSWLGWDRTYTPSPVCKLFEQIVRGGVTVTCGSAGGSHDTNLSWWDNFVFHYLLLTGYEYGDVTLRSMLYLDWTIDMVGDPLYRPDLEETVPDETPPQVAGRDAVHLAVRPAGAGRFALDASADLSNTDPEMVATEVTCTPADGGDALVGRHTHFSARPRATVLDLAPKTEYDVRVVLTDPYGNQYDTAEAIGALKVTTPTAPGEPRVLVDKTFTGGEAKHEATVALPDRELDEAGEVHLWFTVPEGGRETVPVLTGGEGRRLMDHYRGVQIGGARLSLSVKRKPAIRPGREHHLVVRWRRWPVTREVVLVGDDGREFPIHVANTLPWDPAAAVGDQLKVAGSRVELHRVRVLADAPAAPASRRGPYQLMFDFAGYYGEK